MRAMTAFFGGMMWGFALIVLLWLLSACTSGPMAPEPTCTVIWVPGDDPVEIDLQECMGRNLPRGFP